MTTHQRRKTATRKPVPTTRKPAKKRPRRRTKTVERIAPAPFSDPRISHPKKRAFLAAFATLGNISRAAMVAGINRRTHTDWMTSDAEYVSAFEDAKQHGADALEEIAWARAGGLNKGSDTLLIFLLKGLRPEKFRERFEHTGPNGGPIETKVIDEARASLEKKVNALITRLAAAGKQSK